MELQYMPTMPSARVHQRSFSSMQKLNRRVVSVIDFQKILIDTFQRCTRDHNMDFNPVWEYLCQSEMQCLWYEFEYFHQRFYKKFVIQTVGTATNIGCVAGLGAAVGVTGGPHAAAVGALTFGTSSAIVNTIGSAFTGLTHKLQRSYALYKFDAYAQPDLCERSAYLLWLGYDKARYSDAMCCYTDLEEYSFTFKQLKKSIFFKPPKSGVALNSSKIIYEIPSAQQLNAMQPSDDSNMSVENFSEIWSVNKFWPMLDYLFFNHAFYIEFEKYKTVVSKDFLFSENKLKYFLYSARCYFLSRDFYMDHFFENILPIYEFNLLNIQPSSQPPAFFDFFLTVQNRLASDVDNDSKSNFNNNQKIILDQVINECLFRMSDLSVIDKMDFLSLIQDTLSIDEVDKTKYSMQEELPWSPPLRLMRDVLTDTANRYQKIIENQNISESEKQIQIRSTFQACRLSMRKIDKGVNQEAVEKIMRDIFGNEIVDILVHNSGHPLCVLGFDGRMRLTDLVTGYIHVTDDLAEVAISGGISGSFQVCTEKIANTLIQLLGHSCFKNLSEIKKQIFLRIFKFYGRIRILGGTVNYIYNITTGQSLTSLVTNGHIFGASVLSSGLFGMSIFNILVAFVLEQTKTFLYSRMDQECLSVVDRLIVNDEYHDKSPASFCSDINKIIDIDDCNAKNCDSKLEILKKISDEFRVSTLLLPYIHINHHALMQDKEPATSYYSWDLSKALISRFFNEPSYIFYQILDDSNKKFGEVKKLSFHSDIKNISGINIINYPLHMAYLCAYKINKAKAHFGETKNQDGLLDDAMMKLWYQIANCACLLLNFEKKISLSYNNDFSAYIHVFENLMMFLNRVLSVKHKIETLKNFSTSKDNTQDTDLLLSRLIEPEIFTRVLYYSAILLYKNWLKSYIKKIPAALDHLRISLSKSFFLTDSINGKIPTIFIRFSQNSDFLSDDLRIQKTNYNYDSLNETLEKCFLEFSDIYTVDRSKKTESKEWFDNGEKLKYGFKFIKNPSHFTIIERRFVFQDFGRVVRHLFSSAPSPKELIEAKQKLDQIILEMKKKSLNEMIHQKWVKNFFDSYFEYSKLSVKLSLFIHYARIYQFVQNWVRKDFLDSTIQTRKLIQTYFSKDPVQKPDNYLGSIEKSQEILLLLKQLECEHKKFILSYQYQ